MRDRHGKQAVSRLWSKTPCSLPSHLLEEAVRDSISSSHCRQSLRQVGPHAMTHFVSWDFSCQHNHTAISCHLVACPGKAPPVDAFSGENDSMEDWLPALECTCQWNGWICCWSPDPAGLLTALFSQVTRLVTDIIISGNVAGTYVHIYRVG